MKEYERAVECYQKAIEIDPNNAESYYLLGVLIASGVLSSKSKKWLKLPGYNLINRMKAEFYLCNAKNWLTRENYCQKLKKLCANFI